MKLKKALIYLGSFVLLSVMFSTCYYMSYLHALNEFNQKAIERKDQLLTLTQKAELVRIQSSRQIDIYYNMLLAYK